jgi:hypothetical protein
MGLGVIGGIKVNTREFGAGRMDCRLVMIRVDLLWRSLGQRSRVSGDGS